MFERFLRIGSATVLAQELRAEGVLTTKGRPIDKGYLYKCLSNRTYLGLAIHKGTAYPGEHAAIIDQDLWDKVHAILAENGRTRSARTRAQTPALLKGLIFGPTGAAMSPTHTRKGNRLYRYYVSQDVLQHGRDACPVGPRAGGGDRGGGDRAAAGRVPAAGDHRRHLARRARGGDGRHRGRGSRGAHAARPALGRAVPGRAGADRAAAGRAGVGRDRRRDHPASHQRTAGPGARSARDRAAGRMTDMSISTAEQLLAFAAGRRFHTVLADPPWRFQNRTGKVAPEHRRLRRYGTLPLEEIKALPVAALVAEPAHLYLWVPNALLREGLEVMAAWGFGYKTTLVWHKVRKDGGSDGRGPGFYFRNVTESVLFGVRGKNARTLAPGRRQTNLIASRKREHSRKPDELYPIIEACSRPPFLELFARAPRPGWSSWGEQLGAAELPIAAE